MCARREIARNSQPVSPPERPLPAEGRGGTAATRGNGACLAYCRVTSGPSCADPPKGRVPWRLSASRMMIHGEIYEYFYVYGPGGYHEAGVGHRGDRPPH